MNKYYVSLNLLIEAGDEDSAKEITRDIYIFGVCELRDLEVMREIEYNSVSVEEI